MKNILDFSGKYSLSKTLRFELRPQGKTLDNIIKNHFLDLDERRALDYQKVKALIDEYHKIVIAESLEGIKLEGLENFEGVYFKAEKSPLDLKTLENLQILLRKQIVKAFGANERFKRLFSKELIQEDLPSWLEEDEDKTLVSRFSKFTTYFTGFHENRKNIYSIDPKATAVGFRLIHENLPKFLDNLKIYRSRILSFEDLDLSPIESQLEEILQGFTISEVFTAEFFNEVLTQRGIDVYNSLLGGYVKSNGEKVKGINEYLNLYRQKHQLKSRELPMLKPLYKQILSDRQTASFIPDAFEDGAQLIDSIKEFHESLFPQHPEPSYIEELSSVLQKLKDCDLGKVYFKTGIPLSGLSQSLFKNWSVIPNALSHYYETVKNPLEGKKRTIKYDEEKGKWLKSSFFPLDLIQKAINSYVQSIDDLESKSIIDYLIDQKNEEGSLSSKISDYFQKIAPLFEEGNLSKDPKIKKDQTVSIKAYLDAWMDLLHFIKPLYFGQLEVEKEAGFYGEFEPLFEQLNFIVPLYNKVRSFLTQKPYSTEKIKLNFENSTLLDGWDVNKESDNSGVLLIRDGCYFLAIMDKSHNKVFKNIPKGEEEGGYQKVNYKLLPGANKMLPKVFFSEKNIGFYAPSTELLDSYQSGAHKKGDNFNLGDCHRLIDFFKTSISRHEDWKNFGFQFSNTSSYEDLSGFYREVEQQGYKITYQPISEKYMDELVNDGKIYLFEIYNKDFSAFSKGKPNLHTMYWRALFDEANLRDVVYKLNGQAEIFYRKKSLNYSEEVLKKGHHAEELKGKFNYPIIKDRRFAFDKFQFHVPITLNFKASGTPNINLDVLEFLRGNPDIHIIGIDRGERHLLYITLMDRKGTIKAQFSLNEIISLHEGKEYRKNYHQLLDQKEKGRDEARKSWGTIETIKELKEGYLSQVVHQIARLMMEHNAIVVMEDLNAGFMRGRQKVEKQIYQKFEKMLIEKLNYLVMKDRSDSDPGGTLRALQLSNKFESFAAMGKQNGFIFYVPASLTSKIDPATGFVDYLKPKYESIEKARALIGQFEGVRFNTQKEWFEISIDYSKIKEARVPEGTKNQWTLISTPHMRYRWNRSLNQGKGAQESVYVQLELQDLFGKYGIPYAQGKNLLPEMMEQTEKEFFVKFLSLVSCLTALRHNNGIKGDEERDFILSSVEYAPDKFFNSEEVGTEMPQNADANGAFNIARKGLWVLDQLDKAEPDQLKKVKLAISNQEWLKFVQC
jgi:transposase